jgi:putative ABC transport system ATP-binding protein
VTRPRGVAAAVSEVRKSFDHGRILALQDVSFKLEAGEFVALTGPSGCGKSTLLNLIGALDRPDAGAIVVGGTSLDELEDVVEYRATTVGFVFQFHNLISTLSAIENVQVPLIGRAPRAARVERAHELLAEVGLADRMDSSVTTLSGGERQRVAIARALANRPGLLLGDEPTGSLDSDTGTQIVRLLLDLREQHGMTILLVTNDPEIARMADRTLAMRDGRVVEPIRDAARRPG